MEEKNLTKILEYGKISLEESLQKICKVLNLEFYLDKDLEIFTISSDFFVLDIQNKNCTLIFVDEELNSRLTYIQSYLNNFLENQFMFYYILKYLKSSNSYSENKDKVSDCSKYKCICNCIVGGEYCQVFDLSKVPASFNIFTHSEFKYPFEVFFNQMKEGMLFEAPENFANLFTFQNYSKKVLNHFIRTKEFLYESQDVKVIDKSVYILNKRSPIASFAFLKGCTLAEALEYDSIFEKT